MTPDEKVELYNLIRNIRWRYQLDTKFEDPALEEIGKIVSKARNEIINSLEGKHPEDYRWTDQRNAELLDELNELTVGVKNQLGSNAEDLATIAFEKSVEAHNSIMSLSGAASNVSFLQLAPEQISAFLETPVGGMQLSEWVNRTFDYPLQERLGQELGAGMFRGESYKKLVKRVDDALGEAAENSETLVRSWVQASNVEAQKRVMDANADIVKGWRWSAVLENGDFSKGVGTCLRCMSLDAANEVYPLDGGPEIPLHPNCRCVRITVTKTFRELGIDIPELDRAMRNANIRGSIDPLTGSIERGKTGTGGLPLLSTQKIAGGYDEFFETLGADMQQKILGKGRYELWRQGKIRIEDLADAKGKQLTIKELKK